MILQFVAVRLLGLVEALAFDKRSAEPVKRRERERLRLVVDERCLKIRRTLKCSNGTVEVPGHPPNLSIQDAGYDAEKVLRGMHAEHGRRSVGGLRDAREIECREVSIALFEVSISLGEVPQPSLDIGLRAVRYFEHFVETAESYERQHFVEGFPGQLGVILPGAHGYCALAVVRSSVEQHVQVVFRVNSEALPDRGFLIRMPRGEIGAHRVAPAAYFVPGVRWHVIDMAGARNRLPQELGARLCAARHDGGFGSVHVQVASARMPHVAREDTLEQLVQPMHVRVVHIPRAAARLE